MKHHDSFAETDQSIFYIHRQSCKSAIEYNMKNYPAILAFTVMILGLAPGFSHADVNSDREAWDHIEMDSVNLQNDGSVSEGEANQFEEVIILGKKGETEDAIQALNEFLRGKKTKYGRL